MSDGESSQGRRRHLPALLAMVTTVAAAVVAGLQADADIRADVANRQSQDFAIRTAGEVFRQGLRSDFDFAAANASIKDALEASVLELAAFEREDSGDPAGAQTLRQRADIASARADRIGALSSLLTDPAYAPESPGAPPDFASYLEDSYRESNRLLALQNQAADAYGRWNRKSDAYVAILALLAMALFLFGLAQASSERVRLPFSLLGAAVLGLAMLWALSAVIV